MNLSRTLLLLLLIPALPACDLLPGGSAGDATYAANPQRTAVYRSKPVERLTELVWRARYPGVVLPPLVSRGTLYLPTDSGLYAFDAESGAPLWRHQAVGFGMATVSNGLLIIQADTLLLALDPNGAGEKWRASTPGKGFSTPAVVDGILYTCGGGGVRAVDVATRQEKWKYTPRGRTPGDCAGPAIDRDIVFIAIDSTLHAIDARTGQSRWEASDNGAMLWTAVDGETVLAITDKVVQAFGSLSGEARWSFPTSDGIAPFQVAIDDGKVFFRTLNGTLFAVDLATGKELWRFETEERAVAPEDPAPADAKVDDNKIEEGFLSSPAVAGRIVYVGGQDGRFYALDTDTGAVRWSYQLEDGLAFTPVVADGMVYFAGSDGYLYALR